MKTKYIAKRRYSAARNFMAAEVVWFWFDTDGVVSGGNVGVEMVGGGVGKDPVVCIGIHVVVHTLTEVDVGSWTIISMRNITFTWSTP